MVKPAACGIAEIRITFSLFDRDARQRSDQGRIVVSFEVAQRETYDAAVAIGDALRGMDRLNGHVDPERAGSISFDGGATAAPFEPSFRGQSSIECARRNWSIDLTGGDPRQFGAGTVRPLESVLRRRYDVQPDVQHINGNVFADDNDFLAVASTASGVPLSARARRLVRRLCRSDRLRRGGRRHRCAAVSSTCRSCGMCSSRGRAGSRSSLCQPTASAP
jgi:hypothetical protein